MTARLLQILVIAGLLAGSLLVARPAEAGTPWCGGSTSNGCACGKVNIYPCCGNNANCTWYAWRSMCCHWGYGPGNWGNANTWAGNGGKDPNVAWLANPVVGAIATRNLGQYGHVAYVVEVGAGKVRVEEQNCNYGPGGVHTKWYSNSYFNSGFLMKKSLLGPACGNGKCEGGENCANCGQDCGGCCGNGACDWGENCASCTQDCGPCCGNGACDHGETCGSCTKDCKCLPQGELGQASCSLVNGWTFDPNVPDQKLAVRIKVDGAVQAQTTASGPYPGHDGRGYAWTPTADFKQGQVCKVTVEAQDADQDAFATFGPKAFVCENHTTFEGMWATTRQDAAGIAVELPAGPHQGLRHAHAASYPYPLAGEVLSCAQPGLEPFDALRGTLSWDLASHHHAVALVIDGKPQGGWQGAAGPVQELVLETPGEVICVRTTALAEVLAPVPSLWTLADLRWRKGRWWNGYSANGAGLVVGHPERDGATMQLRPDATKVHGSAETWLDLPDAFDSVRYLLKADAKSGLQAALLADAKAVAVQPGAQIVRGLDAKRLTLRAEAKGQPAAGAVVQWRQVRVLQSTGLQDGPWTVQRHDAWGLDAGVPDDATPSAAGLAVTLGSRPMGWWSTGVVSATAEVKGVPFERVRARLQPELAAMPAVRGLGPWQPLGTDAVTTDVPRRLELRVDDQPVATLPTDGTAVQALDVAATGHRLAFAYGLQGEAEDAPVTAARLDGIEWLRRGWWSAPSPSCAGLRDDRPAGGGVRLETARAWGMAGHALQGFARVHRTFDQPQTGVRFHYRQDLGGMAMRVLVLADDAPLAVFDDDGALDKDVELLSPGFTDLALVLTPKEPGGVHPHEWWAEFTAVATRDDAGKWHATDDAPLAGGGGSADAGLLVDTAGGAVTAPATAGSSAAAGCAAAPARDRSALGLAPWLVALAVLGWRRRRVRHART